MATVCRWVLVSALMAVLLAGVRGYGWAEEEDRETHKLEEVVVTAKPEEEKVPSYVQDVVTEEEVSVPSVSDSIVDSLKDLAGVQLRRSSVAGNEGSSLRLRGFGETRLRVLVDGNPFQRDGSYATGPVDWSLLSSEDVERIEVHRGAGPAKFGNTLGGVINVVTKEPTEKPETMVSSVYGSLNTWDSKVAHRWKRGPVGWDFAASHYETDGFLRNDEFDRNNVAGKFTFDLPRDFKLGVGVRYTDVRNEMPVYNLPDSPYYDSDYPDSIEEELIGPSVSSVLKKGAMGWGDDSKVNQQNTFINANISKKFELGSARLDYLVWNEESHEVYYDSEDSSKKIYERKTDAEDGNWQLTGNVEVNLPGHKIETGGELRQYGWGDQDVLYIDESVFTQAINYRPFYKNGFKGQPRCLTYLALYAQDTWQVHPRVDVELGVRGEVFEAAEIDPAAFGFSSTAAPDSMQSSAADPRLALTYRPWQGGALTGRFGMVHRYPNSPEYFWWYLNKGTSYFNTDLNPERALQYEVGFEQALFGFLEATVRGYYYLIDDYISSTTVTGVGQVVYNIGQVDVKGVELGAGASLPYGFKAWANLTLQEGDKKDDPWDVGNALTAQVPDLPETMVNFGLDYQYKDTVTARLSVNYVGSRDHLDGKEVIELDPYTLLNLFASYRFLANHLGRWEVLFTAENMLDESYQEEDGYPMPGATVIGGLRVQF